MVMQTGAKLPSMQTHILGGGQDGVALAYQEEAHGCHQELKQLDEGGVLTIDLILHIVHFEVAQSPVSCVCIHSLE